MLTLEQISGHFPPALRKRNPRGMLVEYLQYELLDSLFKNAAAAGSLLAQKMIAVLYRQREKGRDIYDVSFLMGLAAPDYAYIERLLGLDEKEFSRRFSERIGELDMNALAQDVEPFLFSPEDRARVASFHEYWSSD